MGPFLSSPRTTGDHKQQENAGPCEYSAGRGTVRPSAHSMTGRTFPLRPSSLQPCKVGTTRILPAGGFLFSWSGLTQATRKP